MTRHGYLSELWRERRALATTFAATGVALAINVYVNSLFIPALIDEFGWTRSQFAITGTMGLLGLLSFPFWGRMADRFGARRVSLVGVIAVPSCFFAYSFMTGDIRQYYAIYTVLILCGAAASTPIYGRIVANRTQVARGLALAILMAGPPVIGGLAAPWLNDIIVTDGWRTAYRSLAALLISVGLIAWMFLPSDLGKAKASEPVMLRDYAPALRSPAFIIVMVGMLLCNFGNVLAANQLTPMLLENGMNPVSAGQMVSLFAASVVIGRFLSGYALDRLPTAIVAAIGMGLPAIGLLLLWGGTDTILVLSIAVALLGLSQGAEGDIGGFAAARYLGPRLFGLTYGLIVASVPAASAIGSVVLTSILHSNDSFAPFILLSAVLTVIGALAFLGLSRLQPVDAVADEALEGTSTQ
jgi:MFS family permease